MCMPATVARCWHPLTGRYWRDRHTEVRLGAQWIRWTSPTCSVNNVLLPGSMWLDYHGHSVVEDVANGLVCAMRFETATWKNAYAKQHKFSGTARDAAGAEVYAVEGDWSKYVDLVRLDSGERRRVWELEPEPLDRWGRSAYSAAMLAGPADAYALTDIRWREDIQALASGDSAAAGSARVVMQSKRSDMESIEYEPRLFQQLGERYVLKPTCCRSGCSITNLPTSGVIIRDKVDSILSSTER